MTDEEEPLYPHADFQILETARRERPGMVDIATCSNCRHSSMFNYKPTSDYETPGSQLSFGCVYPDVPEPGVFIYSGDNEDIMPITGLRKCEEYYREEESRFADQLKKAENLHKRYEEKYGPDKGQ